MSGARLFDPSSVPGANSGNSERHEDSLVNALMARYGQDSSADARTMPKPRGATIVTPGLKSGPASLWWSPESDAVLSAIPRPCCGGGPQLTQLVLNHLRSAGLGDVASVFAQELRGAGFPAEFHDVLRSPLPLAQPSLTQASGLTHLLCPLAAVRSQMRELLTSGAQLFPTTVEGSTHDQMTLHHLITQFEEPMWADACSPVAKHRIYTRPDTGALRAAPINVMIEQLARVSIRPHVSDPEAELLASAEFRRRFYATHRHFCPSRVVLAKLFGRFMVPCSLPLALQYDAHGIVIDCHPRVFRTDVQALPLLPAIGATLLSTSAEAQDNAVWLDLYSRVTKAVQIKVMGVICEWLSMFPEHFDGPMEEALITFVHEASGGPAVPWANTPVELAQGGEKIKLLLAEQNAAMAAGAASRSSRFARATTTGVEHASMRKRRNIAAPNAEFEIEVAAAIQEGTAAFSSASSLAAATGAMAGAAAATSATPGAASASAGNNSSRLAPRQLMVRWTLLTMDESRLANQLTTVDHFLLRRVTAAELFAQSADIGTRGHSNAAVRAAASNVHAFLRRGEETMRWLVCEIIWGADPTPEQVDADFDPDAVPPVVDDAGRAFLREIERRVNIIQKCVSLAFRLLEMNNLHSAFAVYLALRHPAVLRLYNVWRSVPRDVQDNIAELRELFNFERGYRTYRDYLASMQDDDLYPVIPILQVNIDELRRIQSEPTVLLDSNAGPVVHWRKFDVVGTLYSRFYTAKEATVPAEFCALPACISWLELKLHKARQADFETIVRASLKAQPARIRGMQ